jgi:hypothetical protein
VLAVFSARTRPPIRGAALSIGGWTARGTLESAPARRRGRRNPGEDQHERRPSPPPPSRSPPASRLAAPPDGIVKKEVYLPSYTTWAEDDQNVASVTRPWRLNAAKAT